ncbi:MAG: hypothetical protein ACMUHU_04800 [Thermoplasmatota archaeon]
MLRKTIYILLVGAIVLNIGAGIVYNGIPHTLGRIFGGPGVDLAEDLFVTVPPSRSGDFYVTSFNMSVEVERTDEGAGTVSGALSQSGTVTRMMMLEETSWDLKGSQEMVYNSEETGELELHGDISRTRKVLREDDTGRMVEKRKTVLETRGFIGPSPQRSEVDVTLTEVRGSWEELLWRSLLPDNRTFREGDGGSVRTRIDLDEIGVFLPASELEWKVDRIWAEGGTGKVILNVEGAGSDDIAIRCSVLFSDDSAYPGSMEITAEGSYETDEGLTHVRLALSERSEYHLPGSGAQISWVFGQNEAPEGGQPVGGMDGMVIAEGGETSFWATPAECLETALDQGDLVPRFVERYGAGRITSSRSVYVKNDTGLSGSRVWNITLCGPERDGATPAVTFEVGTQAAGTSLVDRKRMELLSEEEHSTVLSADPSRSMLSLSGFQDLLSTSSIAGNFFISKQFSPNMVLDAVHRGNGGSSPFSTLLYNMIGMEREHAGDLYICHVPDTSDPMRTYIVVVDGTQGKLVSETVASGFCTLLFNSYGLDLA